MVVRRRPADLRIRRALPALLLLLLAAAPVRAATAAVTISTSGTSTVRVGDDFLAQVTVTNAGPDTATEVEVTDPLSSALVLASAVTDRGVCDLGATVACHLGSLGVGESAIVTIRATAVRPGTITTTTSVVSPDDAATDDNAASRTFTVTGPTCSVIGSPGADVLVPTDVPDVICGLGGADTIRAGTRDRVLGGDGDDVIASTAMRTMLEGGAGADRIDGGPGPDVLRGGSGDDTLTGGDGDDYLDGGPGTDALAGSSGVDACTETGSSCFLTNPSEDRETGAPVDIRSVRTGFGTTATFIIGTWRGWSLRDAEERAWFLVRFDTMGSSAPDYVAVVRVSRGILRGMLFRSTSSGETTVVSLVVRKLSTSRVSVAVPITRMQRDDTRFVYRWGVSSLWLSDLCSRTVCLDGLPTTPAMLPQPLP